MASINHKEESQSAKIPAPTLRNDKGMLEYEGSQLVQLLHPDSECAALTTHPMHAERIAKVFGDVLLHSPELGWLNFNGKHWERDDRHATRTAEAIWPLSQFVREEAAQLFHFAGELAKQGRGSDAEAMSKAATAQIRHAKQVETKNFTEAALHFAAGKATLRVTHETFDQRPWLLGFTNGVWDNGEWREHRPDDYLLNLCPVEYDYNADRREWEAVLERITGGDVPFMRSLQDVAGYVLSGSPVLRKLPWLYGPKGTGKSTVAELLQTVLGEQSAQIDTNALDGRDARERLGASLWNRRLAVCSESGNKRLDAELLKTLSGGDRLPVRLLYKEQFTAVPRHVLVMVANDAPKVDAYDDALKDRVLALPFIHPLGKGDLLSFQGHARIEGARQDPQSNLVRGFLAWAIDGLSRVHQSQTIQTAPCIQDATEQFWKDTDPLTPFWGKFTQEEMHAGMANSVLRQEYERWCEEEGARVLKGKSWASACKSMGLTQEMTGTKAKRMRCWILPESAVWKAEIEEGCTE